MSLSVGARLGHYEGWNAADRAASRAGTLTGKDGADAILPIPSGWNLRRNEWQKGYVFSLQSA